MDTKTSKVYPSMQEALNDGVPLENIKQTEIHLIKTGPFKGRYYEVKKDGSMGRRVYPHKETS